MLEPKFPEVIDSSMRGSFTSCPRQFYYSYLCGLSSKRLSIHLHFGAVFASALQTFREAFYPWQEKGNSLEVLHEEALYDALITVIQEWGNYPLDEEEPKTFFNCLAGVDYYFEVHPPASDILQPYYKEDGTPAAEFSFALPLDHLHPETGEPLVYGGRLDFFGLYQGQLAVVDEKTTKQLGASWSSSWNLRAQFTGYAYAAHQFGFPVVGTVVRGIAFRKTGFDHAEAYVPVSGWELKRWWNQLNRDVERMLHLWEEGFWDQSLDSACTSYGGCGFTKLCRVPNPENWIEADYTIRRWNPLDRDPLATARATENQLPPLSALGELL